MLYKYCHQHNKKSIPFKIRKRSLRNILNKGAKRRDIGSLQDHAKAFKTYKTISGPLLFRLWTGYIFHHIIQEQFPDLGRFWNDLEQSKANQPLLYNRSLRDPKNFAINNSNGRQSKAFEKSVNSAPNALLLSTVSIFLTSLTGSVLH